MRGDAALIETTDRHCEQSEAIQRRIRRSGLLRRFAPLNGVLPLLVVALLLAAPALAGPRTIDDCEAIKDANAYNLCLASFGPVRGQHGANYPGVATEGEKRDATTGKPGAGHAASARRAGSALGYRGSVSRSHGGRVRMEFTPSRR